MVRNPTRLIQDHAHYNVMLHELAHAYDDQELGFCHPRVLAAFQAARQSQRYASIYNGVGTMSAESYANTRAAEYFAELTLSYFAFRLAPYDAAQPRRVADLRPAGLPGHPERLGPELTPRDLQASGQYAESWPTRC